MKSLRTLEVEWRPSERSITTMRAMRLFEQDKRLLGGVLPSMSESVPQPITGVEEKTLRAYSWPMGLRKQKDRRTRYSSYAFDATRPDGVDSDIVWTP